MKDYTPAVRRLASLLLPAVAALAVFAVITALALTPLGSLWNQPRSEALAENEIAIVVQGKLQLSLTAASLQEGLELRLKFLAPDDTFPPKDLTLYTPPSFRLSEVAGIPIRNIGRVTHEDRTSYVIPLCSSQLIAHSSQLTCLAPELRFTVASPLPSLHLTHIGSHPLLLQTALLDLSSRAVSRATRIVSGETDLPL